MKLEDKAVVSLSPVEETGKGVNNEKNETSRRKIQV
jgi:hypothetical protein